MEATGFLDDCHSIRDDRWIFNDEREDLMMIVSSFVPFWSAVTANDTPLAIIFHNVVCNDGIKTNTLRDTHSRPHRATHLTG